MFRSVLAALAVVVTQWPMYQFRPDHNAVFPGTQSVAWTHKLGGKVNGGLAIVRGVIYVESFDRRVSALDARSGRLLWSTRVSNVVMTTPIVADGIVVAGTGTSNVLEQSATRVIWGRPAGDWIVGLRAGDGRILWRYRTVGQDMPSPALAAIGGVDAIVFANGDNHLRALAIRTGKPIWQQPVDGIATMSSAALAGGRVFVVVGTGSHSGKRDRLLAIDPANGRIVWSAPYGNADCPPAIANGTVFVEGSGSDQTRSASANAFNDVAAVDERTGKRRWQWFSGFGVFTTVGGKEGAIAGLATDGALYESIPVTNQFIAFDARSGRIRWKLHTAAPVKMSAVEFEGTLYFGDTGHTWYVVNAKTGSILQRKILPSYFTPSSPVIVGRTIYVTNNDTLYALVIPSAARDRER